MNYCIVILCLIIFFSKNIISIPTPFNPKLLSKTTEMGFDTRFLNRQSNYTQQIVAERFEMWPQKNVFNAFNHVVLTTPENKLESQSMTFNFKTNLFHFNNPITLTSNLPTSPMVMTSKLATYNLSKELFIAKGHVRFSDKNYSSSSNKAFFYKKQKLVVFTGDVELLDGDDYIKGSKVTLNLKNNTIRSKGHGKMKVSKERLDRQ